jgi:hypothetical protein
MTKLFTNLILMAGMVMSFATVDAQRPSGHRWYGAKDGSLDLLNKQIKGSSWSQDWRISRDEAVNAYMFNLDQGLKMLGPTREFGIREFVHVLQNSTEESIPGGIRFTNTLVQDDGKVAPFEDTVAEDGEKFFVYTDNVTGGKIAWAKATCMQSTLLVMPGNKTPAPLAPAPDKTVYAQTPEVNITTGDVNVAAPIVTVVDSTGNTYITNNYNEPAARTAEPYYNQGYATAPIGMGMGMGAGLYAQASFGLGMQQPVCNTWANSMYYGPRTGGGYVIPSGGGGSSTSNQPVNVFVDVYNNIDNTNTNSNTNNNNVEVPFYQDPHIYNPHPNPGGGPVDPPNGNPPTGGTGTGGGPSDPENKPVRGYATKGGGRQTNLFTAPTTTSTSTGPRSTQSSVATSTNDVSAKRGVTRGTTVPQNATPASSRSNNNTLVQRGVGPARNAQSTQTSSPRTVAVSRNANQQSPAAIARNGNANSQQTRTSQNRNNQMRTNAQQRSTQNRSFAQPRQAPQVSQSRPANNMGGSRQMMSAPRPSGASVGMRR